MSTAEPWPEPPGGWLERPPRLALEPEDRGRRGIVTWLIYRVARFDAANVFGLLAGVPSLFAPWLWFAARLNPYGSLTRTDTELVVLRVAWNCRCRYEWEQHVTLAREAGVEVEEIERVPHGPEAEGWSPFRRALLEAADDLHGDGRIGDATWERLAAHLDRRRLLELPMLIGSYAMLAGVIDSVGVPIDERVRDRSVAIAGAARALSRS
jgi:AhpD family alkylhydroperoxidase